jgi:hypothetical protein
MSRKVVLLFVLVVVLVANASAAPITYELVGVVLSDGGTATGTFTYDPVTNTYGNVDITTQGGSSGVTPQTYRFVCGQDVLTCTGVIPNSLQTLFLTANAANQSGNEGLAIFYTGVGSVAGLGTATVFDISNNSANVGAVQEATCSNAACILPNPPSRVTVAGFVVAVGGAITDGPYQVRYAANLASGESYVEIINDGANGAPPGGPGFGVQVGTICVSAYFIDPGEELISCCSCTVTANQTVEFGVVGNLTNNGKGTLNGTIPPSVTIKLLGQPGACASNAAATVAFPVGGFVALGTTLHQTATTGSLTTTEAPFANASLSPSELTSLTGRCANIIGNDSTYGVCAGCTSGALGASKR